ncbi:MAG: glycosyltransferase [Elusimicrobiales bacterium]|nr:glycosyltransferase [Elusimicrobiales bacterium]
MMSIRISIMIPVFNQKFYLSDTIFSAINIYIDNIDIVILDDFSTDGSYEIAKEFEKKDKRIKVFRNDKNYGRSYTYRKLLYELATGEWVLMLDGDDYLVKSNFFKKATDMILKIDNLVAVIGGYIKDYGYVKKIKIPKSVYFSNGMDVTLSYPDIVYGHGCVLYNRKKALSLDFYRTGIISDDLESHLRLFTEGGIVFVDEVVYAWRIHDENETVKKNYDEYLKNINIMINNVYNHLLSKEKDRILTFELWREKTFVKLYRIAILFYGSKEKIYLKKILKDIKVFFNFRCFLDSGLFIILVLYILLPLKIFRLIVKLFIRLKLF